MRQVHGMEQNKFVCNVFFLKKKIFFACRVFLKTNLFFANRDFFLKEKKIIFACLTRFAKTEIH
jgi:hypothetical protein